MQSSAIYRWKHRGNGVTFGLMPTDLYVLGFSNRWDPDAVRTASEVVPTKHLRVRLISAPAFVATKLEAFVSRDKPTYPPRPRRLPDRGG